MDHWLKILMEAVEYTRETSENLDDYPEEAFENLTDSEVVVADDERLLIKYC